jgi:predicted N-acetyltransferase YhbS
MITIRQERPTDFEARDALLDLSFGQGRFDKTSERLREGRLPAEDLSFVAVEHGRIIGTVRLWHVATDTDQSALLLGPLAVAPYRRRRGVGTALVRRALRDARRRGHRALILVGDAPYYARFGFTATKTSTLKLPGPYEPARLLAVEFVPGELDGASGLIKATGPLLSKPDANENVHHCPSNMMPIAA